MVGTAYLTNAIAPNLAASYATVPVLAEQYPSTEVLLGASPDVIIGNLDTYTFDEKVGRSRDSLESKGIKTYVLQCGDEKATFDLMYQRYQELGRIFGVGDKADQFVQGIQDSLAATAAKLNGAPPTTTFMYQKGTAAEGGATTFGGGGIFDAVLIASGGRNIFGDRPSFPLPVVSFETVADRDPQAIVIVDTSGTGSPADKQQFLADQPGLQAVSAIQNKRFFVIQFIDFATGPRIQETVARMGKFLHPSRF